MTSANGVHHIALSTADIRTQIDFFTDVLGMKLVALFPMQGVPGAIHAFVEGEVAGLISFVQLPRNAEIGIEYGKTHAGNGMSPSAPGTLQHLALRVEDSDALLAMRDRIRSRGVNVLGPIDHGMCESIYFGGPEGLTLEIAASSGDVDPASWVDPETLRELGVAEEQLARWTRPAPYTRPETPVPQPPLDPDKPHMRYPRAVYEKMLEMSDAEVSAQVSYPDPPVPHPAKANA